MALAFESTYGTPPADGFTKHAVRQHDARRRAAAAELGTCSAMARDPLAPVKDAVTADGDVVVPLDAEAFRLLAKGGLSVHPITSGTGPWTHEFQSGVLDAAQHVSIETGMPEVPRYAMCSGCVLDQTDLADAAFPAC